MFFEFIRLLKELKPKYFLLENVRMKKEYLDIITEQVSSCYTPDEVDDEFVDMFPGSGAVTRHLESYMDMIRAHVEGEQSALNLEDVK